MHFIVRETSRQNLLDGVADGKIEAYEKKWKKILLNWLTKCVNREYNIKDLTGKWLIEIVNQYKEDIVEDDIERAILCSDDLEPFLKYKYPMLRLKTLSDEKDRKKKLFIMISMMLYHCCICSNTGRVEQDLCINLPRADNEIILYFCKILTDMEITPANVLLAIHKAVGHAEKKAKEAVSKRPPTPFTSDATVELSSSGSESSGANKMKTVYEKRRTKKKVSVSALPSTSVTVMPSHVTDGLNYNMQESTDDVGQYGYSYEEPEPDHDGIFDMFQRELEGEKRRKRRRDPTWKEEKKGPKRIRYAMDDPCYCAPSTNYDDVAPKKKKRRKRSLVELWNRRRKEHFDSTDYVEQIYEKEKRRCWRPWMWILVIMAIILATCGGVGAALYKFYPEVLNIPYAIRFLEEVKPNVSMPTEKPRRVVRREDPFEFHASWAWRCQNSVCVKIYRPRNTSDTYSAHSRCILLCTGPLIWPLPIGTPYFKKKLVAFSTDKLEYKFQTVQSRALNLYLGQAFKYFLQSIDTLEHMNKNRSRSFERHVKRLSILLEVQTDPDPRIRIHTDESYYLEVNVVHDKLKVKIVSPSFAGVKHGLETLTQMILLDQKTGYLITLSEAVIKDGPTFKYRGLMLDTARNFIPVADILKTLDGMASCKLNTFHWRISDGTSFPLVLNSLPNLTKYGAYDRDMVYKQDDVIAVVTRAGVRAIRVLLEVALPGPVGRAWSWTDQASCPNNASTCDNNICVRLRMTGKAFEILEKLYAEIIQLTGVEDIFHLSDSIFSITNCNNLINDRHGFLEQALDHLKKANKGFLPELPIIWYTPHLENDAESKIWNRYGVQLSEWPNEKGVYLANYKMIHSSKWDLSCDIIKQRCTRYKSWQEMYSWRSWRTIESLTIEGGEAILWTDRVDSGNLDAHLWPRTAAVAERLWSDIVLNATATEHVFLRLDYHRWRMLLLGTKVEPIWPMWCSFNPHVCMSKVREAND